MADIQITSWEQFAKIADLLDIGRAGQSVYAFRGQSDSTWDLLPSLVRRLLRSGASEEQALRIEQLALTEFKALAHLHLPTNILSATIDTVSWWTLMQHHGAPTRLLDWCESIYVAAYFAVVDNPDAVGAVWIVHIHTVDSIMAERYEEAGFPTTEASIKNLFLQSGSPLLLHFAGRLTKTDRMSAQQGLFGVCRNVLGNHGDILRDSVPEDTERELFRKVIIPAALKPTFLRKLRSMNITANSLFPGLDGLARSIDELVQVAS